MSPTTVLSMSLLTPLSAQATQFYPNVSCLRLGVKMIDGGSIQLASDAVRLKRI